MDSNKIIELYENNKMFEGKKIKYYKDSHEIKRHKYKNMMPQDEKIIFGIKKDFMFHIMTNKAFYFEYKDPKTIKFTDTFKLERVPLEGIFEWSIDESSLTINGIKIDLGLSISDAGEMFMQGIKSIFEGFEIEGIDTVITVVRKAVDPELLRQICQDNFTFEGEKSKHLVDESRFCDKGYLKRIQSDEKIIAIIKAFMAKYIFTDKAFYFHDKSFTERRIEYEDITDCQTDSANGMIFINDYIIKLEKPGGIVEEQIIYAMENIICFLPVLTTRYESLSPLRFNETIITSEGVFNKLFNNGITEKEIINTAQICRKAFDGYDPELFEVPVCFYPLPKEQQPKMYTEDELGEPLLFKYDNNKSGFYITNLHFGIYKNGKRNEMRLLLSQIECLTLVDKFGKVYLTVNNLENFSIEIIRTSINSCSLMMIALSAQIEKGKFELILSLIEQFIRLGMLRYTYGIRTSLNRINNQEAMINAKFGCESSQDTNFIYWKSNNQVVYLNDTEVIYSQAPSKEYESLIKAPYSDTSIDLWFLTEVGGEEMYFGYIAIGKTDSLLVKKYFHDRCNLKIGSKEIPLNDIPLNDAVLLSFVIAASAI